MKAIFNREFKSYFTSMIGPVFVAALVLVTGIYFMVYNMSYGYPYFAYTLSASAIVFLNCGMRLSELAGINISHLQDDNTLKVIGKGNKERTIYLNEASVYAVNEYLKLRPQIKDDALFLSMREQRMSNRSIQHMIEKHMKNSGLDTNKYSVHKLRHTAATLLYQYGNADIRSLQEILGHESVNTTEIYTHVNKKSLKKMVESNPLAKVKEED